MVPLAKWHGSHTSAQLDIFKKDKIENRRLGTETSGEFL
jgi:hypothetical protein